jgi:hypothetical protein
MSSRFCFHVSSELFSSRKKMAEGESWVVHGMELRELVPRPFNDYSTDTVSSISPSGRLGAFYGDDSGIIKVMNLTKTGGGKRVETIRLRRKKIKKQEEEEEARDCVTSDTEMSIKVEVLDMQFLADATLATLTSDQFLSFWDTSTGELIDEWNVPWNETWIPRSNTNSRACTMCILQGGKKVAISMYCGGALNDRIGKCHNRGRRFR